jgi:hypothetical protein
MQISWVAFAARFGVLAAVLLAGCGGGGADEAASMNNPSPKKPPTTIKEPTPPKGGNETSTGCGEETSLGHCDKATNEAVRCDLSQDRVVREDCGTMESTCIEEEQTGAQCQKVSPPPPPDGMDEKGPCGNGVTLEGYCDGTTAIWCDSTAATAQLVGLRCADYGMSCQVNTCEYGAYCCNPQPTECASLGFFGECMGNTVRFCSGSDGQQLMELDCPTGKTCQVDETNGAHCAVPPPPAGDTFTAGLDGWQKLGSPEGYTLTNVDGQALVSGDNYVMPYQRSGGMMKAFTITPGALTLSFKWRAASAGTGTTNAFLEIYNPEFKLLYSEILINGSTGDTGWKTFSKNLATNVAGQSKVGVVIYVNDAWMTNHMQKLWVDDVLAKSP